MKKKFTILAVALIFVIGIGYYTFFSAAGGTNEFSSTGNTTRSFVARSGESMNEIATALKNRNLIRSKTVFLFLANLRRIEKIPAGQHQISIELNVSDTLNALAHPKQETVKVTIPEGYDRADIDSKLAQMGFIQPGEFSSATVGLEGYLFPDTYFVFNFNFNLQDLIEKMKNNFTKKITPEITQAAQNEKRAMQDVITMASILEKEVRVENDFPIVAGILWKRLDSGWPLQADATLLYGKTSSRITTADLQDADNPYNTSKHKGLPPTPINNPGIVAIRAAAFPEKSPYWFYLTDPEGTVHYAATNEEQNVNRGRYLN